MKKQTMLRSHKADLQKNLRISIFFAKIYQYKPLKVLENYGKIHGVKGTAHIGGNNHGQSEIFDVRHWCTNYCRLP
ncbi:hypothetical protein [Faecalibacterium wellingii]|uniref:hypothetical protein n=1 Tax=Faecalibacterium wellingii TaxID=2929491 RepID=UPI003ED8B468